jgi:hypothetical protein
VRSSWTRAGFAVPAIAVLLLLLSCATAPAAMKPIRVHGRGFVDGGTRRPFVPWGFNYQRSSDYIAAPSAAGLRHIRRDLRAARGLGANVVRIYLQLPVFMRGPKSVDPVRLRALRRVLDAASDAGVRVDVTGNLVWRPATSPKWYEDMGTSRRWNVQGEFWRAVARVAASSPAVMYYELSSEPMVGEPDSVGWYTGELGGSYFGQRIARAAGPSAVAVARLWIRRLSAAIKTYDRRHLISVGLLPMVSGAFAPSAIADELDFLTVHEYPTIGRADQSLDVIRGFAAAGKPVVLGETFTLYDDLPTQEKFLRGTRGRVAGYMTFFDGRTPADIDPPKTIIDAMYDTNLTQFTALRPVLVASARTLG